MLFLFCACLFFLNGETNADIPGALGTIRLFRNGVGDTTQAWSSGIVQIYSSSQWGNICDDDSFGSDEADVICHQLGYTGASSYSNTGSTSTWGIDSSTTLIQSLSCSPTSLTLAQCSFSTSTVSSSCDDSQDVIVTCDSTRIWESPSPGDIRLTNGTYSSDGLLEVYCNGQWGTVCGESFTYTEARIACKQLGYNTYDDYKHLSQRGTSSQYIWLSTTTSCSTSNNCLTSCGNCPVFANLICLHSEDVTLECEYASSANIYIYRTSTVQTTDTCAHYNDHGSAGVGTVKLVRNDTTQALSSGIVEIFYSNQWGNICDDGSFGSNEADVICHQLGYTGASSYSNTGYSTIWGIDHSSTVLSDVHCTSSSYLTLTQCYFTTDISSGCDNNNDVIVSCYSSRIWESPLAGDIRLTGGTYSSQGLLEVYCNGKWGAVCAQGFTSKATKACEQLGYNDYDDYGYTPQENDTQIMELSSAGPSCSSSDVSCLTSCGSCLMMSSSTTNCSTTVNLTCEYSSSRPKANRIIDENCYGFSTGAAPVGTVRLYRNGIPDTTQAWSSGIVEIFYSNQWGNICDDGSFGSDEADVICHQLGYTGASSYSNTGSDTIFGTDISVTALDNVRCVSSTYLTLTQCSFNNINIAPSCNNSNDIIVTCQSSSIWGSPIAGDIRLTGGDYTNQGVIEVYCDGQWAVMCDQFWYNFNVARVTCRQLGYNYVDSYDQLSIVPESSKFTWLDQRDSCSSSDACLTSCGSCPSTYSSCSSYMTLSCEYSPVTNKIQTQSTSSCFGSNLGSAPVGTVRFYRNGVGDTTQAWSSGIVQIFYSNQWGNICDDGSFGSDEADVICHQLGYTGASSYSNTGSDTMFGIDYSSAVFSDVSCTSPNFHTIAQCNFSTNVPVNSVCNDFKDVIVTCYSRKIQESPSPGDLRLSGGNYTNQGLLEIYCGEWGTVCDDHFDSTEAKVACRQLGYNSYVDYDHLSIQGSSSQPIWLNTRSGCSSNSETCLARCSRNTCVTGGITACQHFEDVTLECKYDPSESKVLTGMTEETCYTGPLPELVSGDSSFVLPLTVTACVVFVIFVTLTVICTVIIRRNQSNQSRSRQPQHSSRPQQSINTPSTLSNRPSASPSNNRNNVTISNLSTNPQSPATKMLVLQPILNQRTDPPSYENTLQIMGISSKDLPQCSSDVNECPSPPPLEPDPLFDQSPPSYDDALS